MAAANAANPLLLRIVTGVVLIVAALAAVWFGGTTFAALIAAATLIMFSEWAQMHHLPRLVARVGLGILAAAIMLMIFGMRAESLLLTGFGAVILAMQAAFVTGGPPSVDAPRGGMNRLAGRAAALGLLYCTLPALSLIWLRGLPLGLPATIFLLVCVWTTDIAAFFTGRAIGGPKLAPSISPNKTWAGAIGGILGAMIVGGGLAAWYLAGFGGIKSGYFLALAGALAAISVLGDLYESWLKRRAGVKDSGNILPGHGGVMDRLDGLVPVAIAGAGVFAFTGWAG